MSVLLSFTFMYVVIPSMCNAYLITYYCKYCYAKKLCQALKRQLIISSQNSVSFFVREGGRDR